VKSGDFNETSEWDLQDNTPQVAPAVHCGTQSAVDGEDLRERRKMTESEEHQHFRMQASPVYWGIKAASLRNAAALLWAECERELDVIVKRDRDNSHLSAVSMIWTFDIYGAMLGYSIECLLKGKIILDDPALVSNGSMAKRVQIHDLKKLARMAKVTLSHNERVFCDRVQRMMVTEFRYPIPKSHEKRVDGYEGGGNWPDVYEGLYSRIHPMLNVLLQSREREVRVSWGS